jgi:hypothetical protein
VLKDYKYNRKNEYIQQSKRVLEQSSLIHCWWECKFIQPLWKTVWSVLKTLKRELLYDPATQFLGIYQKEYKSGYNKDTCIPMFHFLAALGFELGAASLLDRHSTTQATPPALFAHALLTHYSQQPTYGNSQDCPLLTNGLRKCG